MEIDIEDVIQQAKAQGWRYDRASNSHHRLYAPDRKTIVTFASTPSDWRGHQNSLGEMRKVGFKYSNGSYTPPKLGDVFPRSGTQAEPTEPKHETAGKGSVQNAVLTFARTNANRVVDIDTIFRSVKAKVPVTTRDSVQQTLVRVAGKDQGDGVLHRLERGMYRWSPSQPQTLSPPPPPTQSPAPPPSVVAAPPPPAVHTDDTLAADIAALDTALAALGEIEGVVRRTKQKIDQLIQLRKALGG